MADKGGGAMTDVDEFVEFCEFCDEPLPEPLLRDKCDDADGWFLCADCYNITFPDQGAEFLADQVAERQKRFDTYAETARLKDAKRLLEVHIVKPLEPDEVE